MEILITVFVLTVCLVPVIALFPTSRVTIRKARAIEQALSVAHREMTAVVLRFPDPGTIDDTADVNTPDLQQYRRTVDGIPYEVRKEIYVIVRETPSREPLLIDVVIAVTAPGAAEPVTMRNRLYRNSSDMRRL